MILLIDNYDSFVHNLARYFARLGHETVVVRSDAIDARTLRVPTLPTLTGRTPQAIVISPGPCAPQQAGASLEIIRTWTGRLPILGVCLGHQAIAEALGGRIVRAPTPMHGRTSRITHTGESLFAGLLSTFDVCRYHSLVVERPSLPAALTVTAETNDGVIMAIAHRTHPTVGVQFHPEAILTEHGYEMLAGFLRIAGLAVASPLPDASSEHITRAVPTVDPLRSLTPIPY